MNSRIVTLVVAAFLMVTTHALHATAGETEGSSEIAVQILGVQGTDGMVCVALYNDPDSYPDEKKRFRIKCGAIKDGKSFVAFKNLPEGTYAAFAFHDADVNGKIKKNFIGIPKEGVGASRGAKGFMGPPKFKDAQFKVGEKRKFIQIKLKYL